MPIAMDYEKPTSPTSTPIFQRQHTKLGTKLIKPILKERKAIINISEIKTSAAATPHYL